VHHDTKVKRTQIPTAATQYSISWVLEIQLPANISAATLFTEKHTGPFCYAVE
jgi:hypothetical protein